MSFAIKAGPDTFGGTIKTAWRRLKPVRGSCLKLTLVSVVVIGLANVLVMSLLHNSPVVGSIATLVMQTWAGVFTIGLMRAFARGLSGDAPTFDDLVWGMGRPELWALSFGLVIIPALIGGALGITFTTLQGGIQAMGSTRYLLPVYFVVIYFVSTVQQFAFALTARFESGLLPTLRAVWTLGQPGRRRWLAFPLYMGLIAAGISILTILAVAAVGGVIVAVAKIAGVTTLAGAPRIVGIGILVGKLIIVLVAIGWIGLLIQTMSSAVVLAARQLWDGDEDYGYGR